MDIFNTSSTPTPATSIDACTSDGFHLNNGIKTTGRKGVLLVGGECFVWDPWAAVVASGSSVSTSASTSSSQPVAETQSELLDARGTLSFPPSAFALLDLLHPKPDLLLLGTGSKLWMLSKSTREYLSSMLGVRVDVMDTGNASAAYNLLAQERGVDGGGGVGAALLPLGWGGRGR
jgi:NADH dehydrogenase [ubiquinone] 1 alpha subcomplex assembly factor 3